MRQLRKAVAPRVVNFKVRKAKTFFPTFVNVSQMGLTFIQLWERLDQVLHGGAPRFLRGDAPEGPGARRRGLHVDRVCQQRQPNT